MTTQIKDVMFKMFPETKSTGVIAYRDIKTVMEKMKLKKFPEWMFSHKVKRGMYAVDAQYLDEVESKPAAAKVVPINKTSKDVALVPKVDANYVPFGNHKDLEQIISSKLFYPTYISGPTGNGKSTMVEQICAKHKRELIRVNLNMMSDEDQLIGSKTLNDGNVEIVEGPVLIAMRTGSVLLLDEIDAGSANTLLCLQPILEGKPYYFKLKNEIITPAPGFNVFATANTKGKGSDDGRYIGTNVLNEAFLERFAVTFEQEYPSAKVELKILSNLMEFYGCKDEEFADTLVKWADAIRRTFEDGGVDETITTRRMTHIVRAFSIFKDRTKAIELCCNRFDLATKTAFLDLFDKVSNPQPEATPEPEPVPQEVEF